MIADCAMFSCGQTTIAHCLNGYQTDECNQESVRDTHQSRTPAAGTQSKALGVMSNRNAGDLTPALSSPV